MPVLNHYFVKLGLFGHIGRLASATATTALPRGRRAVCRTKRGLEVGTVLGPATSRAGAPAEETDGTLLRTLTTEDELMVARLDRNRDAAFDECVRLLDSRGLKATLVDVEHLFDGSSLYFYFLGDVTPEIDRLTRELAEVYETQVQFRQFADAVERGCGPDCGTAESSGCGTDGGCSTCSIAAACKSS